MTEKEIEDMVAGLPEWQQEARRIVYRFMEGEGNQDISVFLKTKLPTTKGWRVGFEQYCPKTIAKYYKYMRGEAVQDRQMGFNASFAIDFIRVVDDNKEGE